MDNEPEMIRFLSSALMASALALPIAARADTNTYAVPTVEQTIHGVITSINGKYGLTVRDDRAETDSVTLHKGHGHQSDGIAAHAGDAGNHHRPSGLQHVRCERDRCARSILRGAAAGPASAGEHRAASLHAEWDLPDERANCRGWRLRTLDARDQHAVCATAAQLVVIDKGSQYLWQIYAR
jgi:hypothetical protein